MANFHSYQATFEQLFMLLKQSVSNHVIFGRLRCGLMVALCLVLLPATTAAQMERSEDDIVVRWLTPGWPIVNAGGYYPMTMSIQNRGPDASIRVHTKSFPNAYFKSPLVEKRFDLAQNATIKLTLLIPIVSYQQSALFAVEKNGKNLEQLQYMTQVASNSVSTPSILVVAAATPNLSSLSQYGNYRANRGVGGTMPGTVSLGNSTPTALPETWLAYSGIESVVSTAKTFVGQVSESQRVELLRWVQSGGRLILVDSRNLSEADQKKLVQYLADGGIYQGRAGDLIATEPSTRQTGVRRAPSNDEKPTPQSITGVESYSGGFGEVRVAKKNLFKDPEWRSWFPVFFNNRDSMDPTSWMATHGLSTRFRSNNYLEFVDPGVQKIPTVTFIILITLFATLIGPVNYIMLRRKNKVPQLLWTTPLIALAASLFLIGWSAIANGGDNKVRLRSFSILDQNSQTLVSKTRASLFSGIAPRGGLRFEPFTEALPIWPSDEAFQFGEVDWTDAQAMKGSFHQGNSRSQFLLTTPRTERGRLQVGTFKNNEIKVTNGLEWSIQQILLSDEEGNLFFGNDLWQGESATLTPATPSEIQAFADEVAKQSLRSPRGSAPLSRSRSRRMRGKAEIATSMGTNQMEQQFTMIRTNLRSSTMELEPKTYLAILSEQPGLDVGLSDYQITEELHVLLGHY